MLRPRILFTYLTIAAILLNLGGIATAQHKGTAEVTVTKCWQFPVENVVALATDGTDVFAAADDGRIIAVSANGDKLWQTDLGGDTTSDIVVTKGLVMVATSLAHDPPGPRMGSRMVHVLSERTGLPIRDASNLDPPVNQGLTQKLPENVTASAISGETVIYGDDHGVVTSLAPGGNTLWRFRTGGRISAVVVAGEQLVVLSRDNFVYALEAKSGGLKWKRRLEGRVGHYALGNKLLVVSSLDQHGASLIDIASGRLAGQILLDGDGRVAVDPVVIDDRFIISTDAGFASYSTTGCERK